MTKLSMPTAEEMRLSARDSAVSTAIGRQAIEEYFTPRDIPDDYRDIFINAQRAAEMAAYLAIQKERELHAADMRLLQAWSDARWAEEMAKPKVMTVPSSGLQSSGNPRKSAEG